VAVFGIFDRYAVHMKRVEVDALARQIFSLFSLRYLALMPALELSLTLGVWPETTLETAGGERPTRAFAHMCVLPSFSRVI
jgi:hypothetical protein